LVWVCIVRVRALRCFAGTCSGCTSTTTCSPTTARGISGGSCGARMLRRCHTFGRHSNTRTMAKRSRASAANSQSLARSVVALRTLRGCYCPSSKKHQRRSSYIKNAKTRKKKRTISFSLSSVYAIHPSTPSCPNTVTTLASGSSTPPTMPSQTRAFPRCSWGCSWGRRWTL